MTSTTAAPATAAQPASAAATSADPSEPIANWLRSWLKVLSSPGHDLSAYEKALRDAGYDSAAMMQDINAEELQKLVSTPAHRSRLLKAAKRLEEEKAKESKMETEDGWASWAQIKEGCGIKLRKPNKVTSDGFVEFVRPALLQRAEEKSRPFLVDVTRNPSASPVGCELDRCLDEQSNLSRIAGALGLDPRDIYALKVGQSTVRTTALLRPGELVTVVTFAEHLIGATNLLALKCDFLGIERQAQFSTQLSVAAREFAAFLEKPVALPQDLHDRVLALQVDTLRQLVREESKDKAEDEPFSAGERLWLESVVLSGLLAAVIEGLRLADSLSESKLKAINLPLLDLLFHTTCSERLSEFPPFCEREGIFRGSSKRRSESSKQHSKAYVGQGIRRSDLNRLLGGRLSEFVGTQTLGLLEAASEEKKEPASTSQALKADEQFLEYQLRGVVDKVCCLLAGTACGMQWSVTARVPTLRFCFSDLSSAASASSASRASAAPASSARGAAPDSGDSKRPDASGSVGGSRSGDDAAVDSAADALAPLSLGVGAPKRQVLVYHIGDDCFLDSQGAIVAAALRIIRFRRWLVGKQRDDAKAIAAHKDAVITLQGDLSRYAGDWQRSLLSQPGAAASSSSSAASSAPTAAPPPSSSRAQTAFSSVPQLDAAVEAEVEADMPLASTRTREPTSAELAALPHHALRVPLPALVKEAVYPTGGLRLQRELLVLAHLQHSRVRGVPRLLGVLPGPRLLLERLGAFDPQKHDALKFARGLLNALADLHEAGVMHRDLAPRNLAVRGCGCGALLDFDRSNSSFAGEYYEPSAQPPSQADDVAALGRVLGDLLEANSLAPLLKDMRARRLSAREAAEHRCFADIAACASCSSVEAGLYPAHLV